MGSKELMLDFFVPCLITLGFLVLFLYRRSSEVFATDPDSREQFIDLRDGQIWHYDNLCDENQETTPWVFIHSIGSSLYCWRHQISEFSPHHRIIALDLLGFGKSDKPAHADYSLDSTSDRIKEFLERKKITRCYLVGCSFGGALCLWLKQSSPDAFPKVIVIAPAAAPELVPFLRFPHHHFSLIGKTLVSKPLIRMALRGGLAHHHKITPEIIHHYFEPFRTPNAVRCFLKSLSVIKDPRLFLSLKNLSPSVLCLWGEKDTVVPRSVLQRIVQQNAMIQTSYHPQGGHHLMEDEPEWTNSAIEKFFKSVSP